MTVRRELRTKAVDNDDVKKKESKDSKMSLGQYQMNGKCVDKTKKQSEKANLRISASVGTIKADVY